jgi:hypothetical protein
VSYDLFFHPRSGELSREDVFEHCAGRAGYTSDEDDEDLIAYENEVTGVYFNLRLGEGAGDPDEDDDDEHDEGGGPEVSFEIDAFRPFVFALEAQIELGALVKAFDLVVQDPQERGIEGGTWDGAAFLRGWTHLNELSYATILRDEWDPDEPLYTLPRAEIERCWRWNIAYDKLVEEFGEHYFVANIAFVAKGGRAVVQALWPEGRPILLPRVDEVLLLRGEGKKRESRVVTWDDLCAYVPALEKAPLAEPGEHWAVTELQIGDRLAPFFTSGTGNARVSLIELDRIHAIEDVERARASK